MRYIVEYDGVAWLVLDTSIPDGDNALVDGFFTKQEALDLSFQLNTDTTKE